MKIFVRYKSTYFFSLGSELPVYSKEFNTYLQALEFFEIESEVVEVLDVKEGIDRPDLVQRFNKAIPNRKRTDE